MTDKTTAKPTQEQWSNVDDAKNVATYASYLDTIRKLDKAGATYKHRVKALMRLPPDGRGLEIGCGTGDDARDLAAQLAPGGGRMVAIDNSAGMISEAKRRSEGLVLPLEFRVGDVHTLDFPDNTFDASRADRVFQHLAEPMRALGEMIRVTRPGGWVVITDPDWGTYALDLPDSPPLQAFLHHAQRQARNYWIGRQLYSMFRRAGLEDVEVSCDPFFFFDYAVLERLGNIDAGIEGARAAGQLTEADAINLRAAMAETAKLGNFFAVVMLFTAAGRKPGG